MSLDHRLFLGHWKNTDHLQSGMQEVCFRDRDGSLTLQVFARGESGFNDLGEIPVTVLSDGPGLTEGSKFAARYDLEHIHIRFHGWVKLGTMVFSTFNRYKDGSGRANFFTREFFRKK